MEREYATDFRAALTVAHVVFFYLLVTYEVIEIDNYRCSVALKAFLLVRSSYVVAGLQREAGFGVPMPTNYVWEIHLPK